MRRIGPPVDFWAQAGPLRSGNARRQCVVTAAARHRAPAQAVEPAAHAAVGAPERRRCGSAGGGPAGSTGPKPRRWLWQQCNTATTACLRPVKQQQSRFRQC